MNVKAELGRKYKEVAMAYFKVLSQNLPEETEENHRNLSQESRPTEQKLELEPLESKA
jgi:hypothetical protein